MEIELGVDIQKVGDFESEDRNFFEKAFTGAEIDYCFRKSKPSQHFAARFAVKEAVIKALSQLGKEVNYKDIEVLINEGKPKLKIDKSLDGDYSIKISMSHSGDYALGFAVVKNEQNRSSDENE